MDGKDLIGCLRCSVGYLIPADLGNSEIGYDWQCSKCGMPCNLRTIEVIYAFYPNEETHVHMGEPIRIFPVSD